MTDFLSTEETEVLVKAIQSAEEHSTGEIRVHIDSSSHEKTAKKAVQVFNSLCKDKTIHKNAVLFHVNFDEKYLTIIGDTGIHQKVKQQFWDTIHDEITAEFKNKNYCEALRQAIIKTGFELKKHFPIRGENPNELPNEITFS